MKLKPSDRMNRRYLLVKGSRQDIEKAILDYIGILGWAKAAPDFIDHGEKIVVAVTREELTNVRAAFALAKSNIQVLRVSGTLKGLNK
jgi:RNase P/RNase MRP subunit POP5